MPIRPSACLLVLSAFLSSAHAADAVDKAAPAVPIPADVVVAPGPSGYIAARIGAAFGARTDFDALGTSVDTTFEPGFMGSVALGAALPTGTAISWRAEAELGYLILDVDGHEVAGVGAFSGSGATGEADATYGLANAYLDYELGTITPYIGAGIGVSSVTKSNFGTAPTGILLDDDEVGLAWQIGAGASYAFSNDWSIELGYRYLDVGAEGVTAVDGTRSDTATRSHQVQIGIRRRF